MGTYPVAAVRGKNFLAPSAFSPLSLSPVALYVGKGAATYAASKVNLANAGTYDLTELVGTVPWTSAGWAFDATNYFDTGIVVNSTNWTILIQIAAKTSGRFPFGAWDLDNSKISTIEPLTVLGTDQTLYCNCDSAGAGNYVSRVSATGNFAVAAQKAYYNGVDEGATLVAGTAPTNSIYFGACNGLPAPFVGTITAFGLLGTALSAANVLKVSDWMAAL